MRLSWSSSRIVTQAYGQAGCLDDLCVGSTKHHHHQSQFIRRTCKLAAVDLHSSYDLIASCSWGLDERQSSKVTRFWGERPFSWTVKIQFHTIILLRMGWRFVELLFSQLTALCCVRTEWVINLTIGWRVVNYKATSRSENYSLISQW